MPFENIAFDVRRNTSLSTANGNLSINVRTASYNVANLTLSGWTFTGNFSYTIT